MFRRILIANRGEIAARVARTAKRLGVEAVVAHSEADGDAPWLDDADIAVCVGPARPVESYLDARAILQAAEQTECQAVHPGYGFLSENAVFAAACEQVGVTFVGPTPGAILRMGDKARAKATLADAGLPTIPGSKGLLDSVDEAAALALRVGYPVLLKATAGGGGRGMRVARDESELRTAFDEAAREAEGAFGDAGLYLEKMIERGRHIEFQVLCDAYGAGVHFGERECSVQRKHQKLVEESPSPALDDATRRAYGERIASAVAALGYRGVGTVELLRDASGELYFMEMNTRLQVEHPVTEAVTGVDLVEAQLRVAAGEPLWLEQADIAWSGHAIELRINAEDPEAGFRPDPGTIRGFTPPSSDDDGVAVRWDSAVRAGYTIPPYYDSMIGKLIVHAVDRGATIAAAEAALASLAIEGVRTTAPLHARILADARFRSGEYDVGFLETSVLSE